MFEIQRILAKLLWKHQMNQDNYVSKLLSREKSFQCIRIKKIFITYCWGIHCLPLHFSLLREIFLFFFFLKSVSRAWFLGSFGFQNVTNIYSSVIIFSIYIYHSKVGLFTSMLTCLQDTMLSNLDLSLLQ